MAKSGIVSAETTSTFAALVGACAVAWGLWLARSRGTTSKRGRRRRQNANDEAPPPPPGSHGASSSCCGGCSALREHTKIFTPPRVIRVAEDVLVAVGYGLANSICVKSPDVDDDRVVIIDTCENEEAARECLRDFKKVPGYENMKVAGVIYTHFHHDHVGGTGVFLEESSASSSPAESSAAAGAGAASSSTAEEEEGGAEGAEEVEVWAHHSTEGLMRHFSAVMGPIAYTRSARQFGYLLRKPGLENSGIGPFLRMGGGDDAAGGGGGGGVRGSVDLVLPNRSYGGEEDGGGSAESGAVPGPNGNGSSIGARRTITVAGVTLQLIHAPGETDDQTVVYLPSRRILFAADNYYEAFPNLYAIRGVPYRDPMKWVRSLDVMRTLRADVMVPSHTLPVVGRDEVELRLRNYRDAIAHVHDQTIRYALRGYHPDAIADMVKLPDHMKDLEYLKEYYGTVKWSCKSIFHGYMGWFSGDPSELFALNPTDRSERLVELGGGAERCIRKAREAMERGARNNNNGNVRESDEHDDDNDDKDKDLQWALELITAVTRACPANAEARSLRISVLRTLGESQICANARNYYLTSSLEADGTVDAALPRHMFSEGVLSRPIEDLFDAMRYRIVTERAMAGGGGRLRVDLTDTEKSFVLVVRNAVLTVVPIIGPADIDASDASSSDEGGRSNAGACSPRCSSALRLFDATETEAMSVRVSCTEGAWKSLVLSPVKTLLSGRIVFEEGTMSDFRVFMSWFDRTLWMIKT